MNAPLSSSGQWNAVELEATRRILHRIFRAYPEGFLIKLWDDSLLKIGNGAVAFTLSLKAASVPRELILHHDPVRLAEAYFDGAVEVEGDFNAAIKLRYYLENLELPLLDKLGLLMSALHLKQPVKADGAAPRVGVASKQNDQQSIAFHYDVSNAFYQLWLDERMIYSCAYFETADQSLAAAQCHKLDHICRKLRLAPGETLLDIGCGWGALVCWAAKHYQVRAHGITLSQNQFDYAQQAIKAQGLEGQVSVELRHYQDLDATTHYDKVSSIGMFEHVGLKNLPLYFATVWRVLKPKGLFLNHGITSAESGWKRSVSTEFINRHVFPDGELDTISNISQRMEAAHFEIFDVEGLRPHYAMTLRHWVARLEAQHERAVSFVGERIFRIWRLYMTASAIQFEQGQTGIYQILACKRDEGLPNLPLTRRDIYR